VLITGVGTGGHITACAQVLKKDGPALKVFAVEPTLSPGDLGRRAGVRIPIQGIGAGFRAEESADRLLDGVIQVDPNDAKEMARRSAREEGILVGISSGASLAAGCAEAEGDTAGQPGLCFNYDTGERYLSVPDFLPE
jgi:cysteine synthase A